MGATRPHISGICALVLASLPLGALAEPPNAAAERPITVRWIAPSGCASEAYLVARIDKLLGAKSAAPSRHLDAKATVEAASSGFRLGLTISTGQAESTRILQGTSCEALADAAALVIALAFDPEAVSAQEGMPSETEPSEGPDAKAGPPADEAPKPQELVRIPIVFPALSPPAQVASAANPPPRAAVRPPTEAPFSFGAMASLAADIGSLGELAPGVRAGLSFGLGAFRVEPAFEAFPDVSLPLADRPSAGVKLRLLAFALDGCRRLLPWDDTGLRGSVYGCVGFEIGELRGEGFGVATATSAGVLWASPRAAIKGELSLSPHVAVTVEIGTAIPLDRKQFVLDLSTGRTLVHEPAPVSGRAGLGFAFRY